MGAPRISFVIAAGALLVLACAGLLGVDDVSYGVGGGPDASLDARNVDGAIAEDGSKDVSLVPIEASTGEAGQICPLGCSVSCVNGRCTRVIFVSSRMTTGAIGGIDGGDAICGELTQAKWPKLVFKAWLAGGGLSPASFSHDAGAGYVDPKGALIAGSWSALVGTQSNDLFGTPSLTEDGGAPMTTEVWTGVAADGQTDKIRPNCGGWISGAGFGAIGISTAKNATWTSSDNRACYLQASIYCVEQ